MAARLQAVSTIPPQRRRQGAIFRRGAAVLVCLWVWCCTAADPYRSPRPSTPLTELDRLVLADLERLGIPPAEGCSDAVFVRRAFLDVIGTLPTAGEARAFLDDPSPDKRIRLIEQLLARPEFADYWAMKWSDLLRVKAEFPINLWPNAAQAYHRWILASVRTNKPLDRFARELLTASGSNFRDGPANFYRALQDRDPTGMARVVALTFLAARAEHWPSHRLAGLAAFFSQVGFKSTSEWKEEIVFHDPSRATNGLWRAAVFPDGTPARLEPGPDPRVVFADWLVSRTNTWFAQALANRIWAWVWGRGIVHEPDDFRPDNPPRNPALLDYLAREWAASGYDFKHLLRVVLNSGTYQRSCVPRSNAPAAAAHFAHYPLRRLEAEVLVDALNQITGTAEQYTSPIPEPFTFIPADVRAIALADGSVTSPFLELFGRPPRDTGLESERNNQPSPAQRLHLLNSSHILRKLEQGPRLRALATARRPAEETLTELYLTILSRPPTEEERQAVNKYTRTLHPREAFLDVAWALINSPEFLYRH